MEMEMEMVFFLAAGIESSTASTMMVDDVLRGFNHR
jgi:hypothetical protein